MRVAPARYFAPTFFSPYYFASLVAPDGPVAPARYFAPTFFTPYYFPSLVTLGPPDGVAVMRDGDGFKAILDVLAATGEFAIVSFGTTADRRSAGADLTPAAVVTPDAWYEADDTDPVVLVRRVFFTLTLVVRDEDPLARYDALDRLSCVALNALDGADLGGDCIAALTRAYRGRFEPTPTHPEQSVAIHGEFTYLIPSLNGHKTSR
jgi:hypothetical protein